MIPKEIFIKQREREREKVFITGGWSGEKEIFSPSGARQGGGSGDGPPAPYDIYTNFCALEVARESQGKDNSKKVHRV